MNFIINLFKKKQQETKPDILLFPKLYVAEISHLVSYKEDDTINQYKSFKLIETENEEIFNQRKEEYITLYKSINKAIYESVNNNTLEYINIEDTFIIRKSDFVNAKLIIKNNPNE